MASVMTSLLESVKADMEHFSWVNWSKVGREAFIKKINKLEALEVFEKLLEKSEFTEKDAIELSNKVKEGRLSSLKRKVLSECWIS